MKEGDSFRERFTVSEGAYRCFTEVFRDKNPLHTDRAFAQGKGFREEVMHGNILGGFISYFIGECLPVKDVIIHSQEIKHLKPVYLNDVLDFYASVSGVFESVKAVELAFYFENKDKVKVAKGKIQIGLI